MEKVMTIKDGISTRKIILKSWLSFSMINMQLEFIPNKPNPDVHTVVGVNLDKKQIAELIKMLYSFRLNLK